MSRLPGPRRPAEVARFTYLLARDPYRALLELHRRYGPVVAFGAGPLGFVYLLGRDANEYLLSTDPGNFRWGEAFQALIPVVGETALVVTDGEDHKRRRRLVQPAFHAKRINGYLDLMIDETDRLIDGWTTGGVVDAHGDLRLAIRRIVVRALFGERMRDRADELGGHLEAAIEYVNLSPVRQLVKVDRPFTRYGRAMAAKGRADAIVFDEIARRRADPADTGDVLDMLLAAGDEDGSALSDGEVRDQIVSLVAAGFDTTSAAVAWAVYALLADHRCWDRLRAEVADVPAGEPVSVEALGCMRYLDGVVHEVLRLYPPAYVSPRVAVEDFTVAGHTVPGGSRVLFSPYVSGRLPELWPDPEAFRPERWDPDHPSHVEPQPYAWVPFGGPYRRCIGHAFAMLEMKAILVALARRTDLELAVAAGTVRPTGLAAMAPKGGVPVRVTAVRPAGAPAHH